MMNTSAIFMKKAARLLKGIHQSAFMTVQTITLKPKLTMKIILTK